MEMDLKEAIEIAKDVIKSREALDKELGEENKFTEAVKVLISKLQLLEQVEKDGVRRLLEDIVKDVGEGYSTNVYAIALQQSNKAINLCQAEWVRRLEGIEEVIYDKLDFVIYRQFGMQVTSMNDNDIRKLTRELSQAIITHLTGDR